MIYGVLDPRAIAAGPARPRVVELRTDSVRLALHARGRYRVGIRYSPYWSSESACVGAAPDGMISLVARVPGRVDLQFAVTAEHAAAAVVGEVRTCSGR